MSVVINHNFNDLKIGFSVGNGPVGRASSLMDRLANLSLGNISDITFEKVDTNLEGKKILGEQTVDTVDFDINSVNLKDNEVILVALFREGKTEPSAEFVLGHKLVNGIDRQYEIMDRVKHLTERGLFKAKFFITNFNNITINSSRLVKIITPISEKIKNNILYSIDKCAVDKVFVGTSKGTAKPLNDEMTPSVLALSLAIGLELQTYTRDNLLEFYDDIVSGKHDGEIFRMNYVEESGHPIKHIDFKRDKTPKSAIIAKENTESIYQWNDVHSKRVVESVTSAVGMEEEVKALRDFLINELQLGEEVMNNGVVRNISIDPLA